MPDDAQQQFRAVIDRLPGLPCWSVQVSGVGSLVNLQLGNKVKRDYVMAHPDFELSTDERVFQGEIILYLEECPWRLDGPESVICTWMDENTPEGRLTQGIMQLKDRIIQQATLSQPGLDLTLTFDGNYVLRVFPDQINPDEGDNYSLTAGDETFVIAARSTLYIE